MNRINLIKYTGGVLSALCLVVAGDTIAPAAVQQYQHTTTCAACHTMPPTDSVYRNITTGGFKGSHFTHNAPAVAPPGSCEKCHSGSSSYLTSHMSDTVEMADNINNSPHPSKGLYDKPLFFNQTSNPVMQTCSNVNCHFESITPAWSSTPFDSPADCNGCHGAAPADGSHPATSGSGKKHGDYYTTTTSSCGKCHPDHTAEAAPFAHATSAGHRGLIISFTTGLNGGFGRYTGNVSYPNYLPSQSPPRNGTCRTTYCHSPGNKNTSFDTPNTSAVWGGTLDCKGCHRSNSTSGAPMATGSHGKHLNGVYSTYACVRCHAATATAAMTIATLANHVDGQVNVAFNNSTTAVGGTYAGSASPMTKAPGSAYGTCSNVYCHSTVQPEGGFGAPTYKTSPAWGSGTYLCGQCHLDGSSHGGTGTMASGSHTTHLSYSFQADANSAKCTICHNVGGRTYGVGAGCESMSCHANGGVSQKHSDHNVDVLIPAYFGGSYNGTPEPGDGYGACSNVYCHSDGKTTAPSFAAVTWGTSLDCTGCHGSATANGAAGTALSEKHQAHVNNEAVLGTGNSFHCIDCHQATVSSDTAIASTIFHVNKLVNYTGAKAGGPLRYDSAAKVCSNFYCHSNGNAEALVFRSMTGSKSWGGSASLGCNGCHGNATGPAFPTGATGAPNYPSGGSGTNTANSHKRHVADAGITSTTGCAICHVKTVDNAVDGRLKNYTAASYHLDRTVDVNFKNIGGATGVLNADRSCSSTYCHGAAASPKWGETSPVLVPLACNRCHSANSSGSWATTSAHKIHWESGTILPVAYINYSGNVSSSGSYRFTCSSCHSPRSATHATGPVNTNRVAEVFFSISSAGLKGSYTDAGSVAGTDNGFPWTAGTTGCNTTYCHSNGRGGNGLAAVAWSTTTGSGTCVQCHDTASATVTPTGLSGKHDRHMNPANNPMIGLGNGFGCIECHAKTVSGTLTVSDKSKHVNKFLDYSGVRAGGSSRYNAATRQCTNIYCHSNGNRGAVVYENPLAWNAGATLGCNGCHGTGNGTGAPDYVNGGAGTATANSHAKHVTALNMSETTGCSACHVKTVHASTGGRFKDYSAARYHLNGAPSVTMASAYGGSFNAATATCSGVSCHGNGRGAYQPVQWGTPSNCGLCHPLASLSATHGKHVNVAVLPVFYTVTGNHSIAATYNFGCSNCHLLDNPNHMRGDVLLDLRPVVAGVSTLRSKNNASITASGPAGTANSGTIGTPGSSVRCLNIYCHSNGYGTNTAFATTPDWYGGSFTGDRCANCHGNAPNSTIAGSRSHYNRRFLGYTSTPGGHQISIHAMGIYSSPSGLAAAGTGSRSSHGNPALATTISCNICHYQTVTTARNDENPVCKTCHYGGNNVGAVAGNAAAIADRSKHVNGIVNVEFQPVSMLSRAQVRQKYFITHAYSSVWKRNAGYKLSGSHDSAKSAFDTATMWDTTTKTCSNIACHNGNSVKWTDNDGVTGCISCHSSL